MLLLLLLLLRRALEEQKERTEVAEHLEGFNEREKPRRAEREAIMSVVEPRRL